MRGLTYTLMLLAFVLTACLGDKRTIVGEDIGEDEFENKQLSGNAFKFSELNENLCEYIDMQTVFEQYKSANVTEAKIDPVRRFMGKNCNFFILFDDSMPTKYSRGMISVVEDTNENEWQVQWEFTKQSLKSASYISGLGKAAIWIDKQLKLQVKMDGYTIFLNVPPTNGINDPNAKQHDYKNSAITILKNSKLLK